MKERKHYKAFKKIIIKKKLQPMEFTEVTSLDLVKVNK